MDVSVHFGVYVCLESRDTYAADEEMILFEGSTMVLCFSSYFRQRGMLLIRLYARWPSCQDLVTDVGVRRETHVRLLSTHLCPE